MFILERSIFSRKLISGGISIKPKKEILFNHIAENIHNKDIVVRLSWLILNF